MELLDVINRRCRWMLGRLMQSYEAQLRLQAWVGWKTVDYTGYAIGPRVNVRRARKTLANCGAIYLGKTLFGQRAP